MENDIKIINEVINIEKLKPHEEVVSERKKSLINYINTLEDNIIIPSVICDEESLMIIDGHHRFFALKEIGQTQIPVTLINYKIDIIRTHRDESHRISKTDLIKASCEGKLFPPKSTMHEIFSQRYQKWIPIQIISKLSLIEL